MCSNRIWRTDTSKNQNILNIICSRLDLDEICNLLSGNLYSYVIDATHPYAAIISENARSACIKTGTPYFRLLRGTTDNNVLNNDNIITFPDTIQAAKYLNKTTGRILLTTGSKDLHIFCNGIKDTKRITARVLPSVQAIETCTNAGLEGRQVIAMHGPFSKELNIAIINKLVPSLLSPKTVVLLEDFLKKYLLL